MAKGLYVLGTYAYDVIYGESEREEIRRLVDIYADPQTAESVRDDPGLLRDADIILSGWGAPVMDREFLDHAPNLRAVFYGAGSIKGIVSGAFWDRGIAITSAWGANGISVAEYTLSQILFCLKCGWQFVQSYRSDHQSYYNRIVPPGAYGSTVGIISLGVIGRRVCELLRPLDVNVLAYDPFIDQQTASGLGVELCPLQEVFERSDVVSLHTPLLPETIGLITGRHFESMKPLASFINTARGAVVREAEVIGVLEKRPDLHVVLDVTEPEPPSADSPLYVLPNVTLTPHIAGALGRECNRLGRYMTDELRRYLAGEPLQWAITRERASLLA